MCEKQVVKKFIPTNLAAMRVRTNSHASVFERIYKDELEFIVDYKKVLVHA